MDGVLNWAKHDGNSNAFNTSGIKHIETITKNLGSFVHIPYDIYLKYKNTIDFYNEQNEHLIE